MRIGVHYTHYQCLGHTTRILSLIALLQKRFPRSKYYCIQGSQPQDYLKYPQFQAIHQLPYPLFTRDSFRIPFPKERLAVEARARECLAFVRKYSLEAFLTEYFPVGRPDCRWELLPALIYLSRRGKIIVFSAGYPVVNEPAAEWRTAVLKFFKRIFIHCPLLEADYIERTYASRQERSAYRTFWERNRHKVSFTGYVLPRPLSFEAGYDTAVSLSSGAINVVVTRGGGAYHPEILLNALGASDILGPEFFFTIIAGPSTTNKEWTAFGRALVAKKVPNASLVRSSAAFGELIADADICVGPAPYNTSVQILKHRKKAVLTPLEGNWRVPFREQIARARMISDLLRSPVISPSSLTPDKLALAIKRVWKTTLPDPHLPPQWFQGGARFVQEFRALL